jgi:hypothetical protein
LTKAVADFVNEYMMRIDDREDAKSEVFMSRDDEKKTKRLWSLGTVRRDRANVRDLSRYVGIQGVKKMILWTRLSKIALPDVRPLERFTTEQ